MHVDWNYYQELTQIADYIYYETPEDSNVLITPECLIINYFTNRKVANTKYYNLILHIIEMYGEENIIEEFKRNPPDYYVWTKTYFPYKPSKWYLYSTDYGTEIHDYFAQNYHIVKEIYNDKRHEELYAVIYKRQE